MSFASLQIGKSGLTTQQAALDVVGQNLTNSATEGYSRQSVTISATTAVKTSTYYAGTGASVDGVNRVVDEYYQNQLRTKSAEYAYANEVLNTYTALENNFNELTDADISSELDNFWSALSDLSLDTSDESLAIIAVEEAESLANTINDLDTAIVDMQDDLNADIENDVNSINTLTSQIAELNSAIMSAEACGSNGLEANDLRDQRELLINDLASIVDINVSEENNGSVSIYNGNNNMVYRDSSEEFAIEYEFEDGVRYSQPVFADGNIAVESESGSLGAELYMRDDVLSSYQDDLDTLAAEIIWEFNTVYSQGVGNSGYDQVTGSSEIDNPEATLNNLDYGVNVVDGTYEIANGSFELVVYDVELDEEKSIVIDVDLDGGDDDTILYDEDNPTAANSLVNIMQTALDDEVPGGYTVSLNNQNQLEITSNSDRYQLGFGRDSSGAVAALGLNNLFDGFDAQSISVNETLADNPSYFAVSDSFTSTNNETVNSLISLRDESVVSDSGQTIEEFYCSLVGTLGIEAENAQLAYETKEDLLLISQTNNESVSGVNISEELVNMMQYQKAFQAAAEFITVADECLQTILDM